MKDKIQAEASQSIQELKKKIRAVLDEIEFQMCKIVMGNFIKRAWSCERSRGGITIFEKDVFGIICSTI